MIEKIIIGIVIGFISGVFLSKENHGNESGSQGIILIFIAIISIAFIGSSFMYGGIFGIMAIGEIAIGFAVASNIFKKNKAMNLEFDRVNIVETSLAEFCSCMERLESNELLLQYAVISIHNALQGTMTLALRNPEITKTWKKSHAKKWVEKELPKLVATEGLYKLLAENLYKLPAEDLYKLLAEGSYQPDKIPQLDLFMELYDKYFSSSPNVIDRCYINNLNKQRNIFIHFNTDILFIEKEYIISLCKEAVKAIVCISKNENEIFESTQKSIDNLLILSHKYCEPLSLKILET
jgi:hypothetical protein